MDCTVLPQTFEFQVAGHHFSDKESGKLSMLYSPTDGTVLKPVQKPPRGQREIKFYDWVWSQAKHPLQKLIPRYYGLTNESSDDSSIVSYLKLENLCERLLFPCVLDVKLGARNCGPDATEEKLLLDLAKYKWATTLGFRFLGYKTFDTLRNVYLSKDKSWGKKVAPDDVLGVLREFFQCGSVRLLPTVRKILDRLRPILSWFESQTDFVFYSSSILICYDAANGMQIDNHLQLGVTEISPLPRVDVRMIDFTHVFPSDTLDQNYLFGLRNFVAFFEEFVSMLEQNNDQL